MAERRNATRGKLAASQDTAKTERIQTLPQPAHDCKIVSIQHREATTSSVTVADVSHKRHDRVLEAIRNILADLPKGAPFFRETSYTDQSNREQVAYEMNRDGFSLLAMGFNGKKALEFKLKYIDAFSREDLSGYQKRAVSR